MGKFENIIIVSDVDGTFLGKDSRMVPENLEAIASFVGTAPWETLPYNELAGAKYSMLNRIYPLDDRKGE